MSTSTSTITPDSVANIFYSGQFGFMGDMQMISKITFLLNEHYLSMKQVVIASKSIFLDTCANSTIINNSFEAAGGSPEHIVLKLLAQAYVTKEYGINSECEVSYVGYIPDVISIDRSIICECGHTNNPEKLLAYFHQPSTKAIIQIPYPNEDETCVYGYTFVANENLIPFLEFENQESKQSIKDIINRRTK